LARAYSSLPTRIIVVSRRRTTAATDLLAREAAAPEVRGDPAPDRRQAAAEGGQAAELVLVAHAPPVGVIAVLLPSARVVARGLDVTVGALADPHALPGRGNDDGADAREGVRIAYQRSVGSAVDEAAPPPNALNSRRLVRDPAEARGTRRRRRILSCRHALLFKGRASGRVGTPLAALRP
jgi:hypothetical protein